MVGTPYLLLAAFGFLIYRGVKRINQAEAARDVNPMTTGTEPPQAPPPASDPG